MLVSPLLGRSNYLPSWYTTAYSLGIWSMHTEKVAPLVYDPHSMKTVLGHHSIDDQKLFPRIVSTVRVIYPEGRVFCCRVSETLWLCCSIHTSWCLGTVFWGYWIHWKVHCDWTSQQQVNTCNLLQGIKHKPVAKVKFQALAWAVRWFSISLKWTPPQLRTLFYLQRNQHLSEPESSRDCLFIKKKIRFPEMYKFVKVGKLSQEVVLLEPDLCSFFPRLPSRSGRQLKTNTRFSPPCTGFSKFKQLKKNPEKALPGVGWLKVICD